jgi:hypothetical protein
MATAATNRMQNMTAQTSAGSGVGTSSWFVIGASSPANDWIAWKLDHNGFA